MKKIYIFIFCLIAFSANAMEKKTTFNKELFDKAQSEGKFVVVSSWIKYCSSCAGQMKILKQAYRDRFVPKEIVRSNSSRFDIFGFKDTQARERKCKQSPNRGPFRRRVEMHPFDTIHPRIE